MAKSCSRCGETKPVDSFYSDKRARDGLASECKACHARAMERWRDEHRDKALAIGRAATRRYQQQHPEKQAAKSRAARARLSTAYVRGLLVKMGIQQPSQHLIDETRDRIRVKRHHG